MPWRRVELVVNESMRGLCTHPYPGHPDGCPNFGRRGCCPPRAPRIGELLDMDRLVYVVWTTFDLGSHVRRMRAKHPNWSLRQLVCCLYWQRGARANLAQECLRFLEHRPGYRIVTVPEACGVNVTETMRQIGETLQWPPTTVTYQVAVAGRPRRRS